MGRKRKHNRDLPERWTRKHGAIYYMVPPGLEHQWDNKKWFRLGSNEAEAYRTWADRVELDQAADTMSQLLDRYLLEHTPTVRPKTQKHHRRAIEGLRKVFGEFNVRDFESSWAFRYYDERKKVSLYAANNDIKLLSHAFTKAIEWGVIKNSEHPLRGLRIKENYKPRDRYVEDWEFNEALSVASDLVYYFCIISLLTGMDKSTILSIRIQDITEDGIMAARIKTQGKPRLYRWTPQLRICIDKVKAMPRPISSIWLFCTRKGQPYVKPDGNTSGFDSIWRRFMDKALEHTALENRFTVHDIRRKASSDEDDINYASQLLEHGDPRVTKKHYRAKPESIETRTIDKDILKRK